MYYYRCPHRHHQCSHPCIHHWHNPYMYHQSYYHMHNNYPCYQHPYAYHDNLEERINKLSQEFLSINKDMQSRLSSMHNNQYQQLYMPLLRQMRQAMQNIRNDAVRIANVIDTNANTNNYNNLSQPNNNSNDGYNSVIQRTNEINYHPNNSAVNNDNNTAYQNDYFYKSPPNYFDSHGWSFDVKPVKINKEFDFEQAFNKRFSVYNDVYLSNLNPTGIKLNSQISS